MFPTAVVAAFLAVLLVALAAYLILSVSRNVAFKQRSLPWLLASADLAFVIFAAVAGMPPLGLALVLISAIMVSAWEYQTIRFCPNCGTTSFSKTFGDPCRECGFKFPSGDERAM